MTKEIKEIKENKALSLKTLTKSSVWDVQENDIFRMLTAAEKDAVEERLAAGGEMTPVDILDPSF